MINWNIAGAWQNWLIIWLMIAISLTGIHIFVDFVDKEKD